MRKQPAVFPSMFINLVEAGEATGTLEISFERMALQFEKENALKSLIKKALTYPVMVGLVAVGVIFALMTFVIPTFMGMFADMDVEMPGITQFVINLSDFFVAYWWLILIKMDVSTTVCNVSCFIFCINRNFVNCIICSRSYRYVF